MSKTIIAVDSQKLNTVSMCAYKYDLSFNRDLVPPEKQAPFERGDLIHRMLESYYKMHRAIERWRTDYTKDKVIKYIEGIAEHHAATLDLPLDEIDNVFRTFREYIDYYWGEPFVTLAVEQVGSKVLYEDEEKIILYEAKIDWIVKSANLQLQILPVDHKSSYRRGETIAISNQFMGYCWMLGCNNLMVNKVGFQKTIKAAEKFTRPIMSYPDSVIESWRLNTIWWIHELIRYQETGYWPQNFTSCDKYSGCIFRYVCEAPVETRDNKIAQMFEVRPEKWDVGALL